MKLGFAEGQNLLTFGDRETELEPHRLLPPPPPIHTHTHPSHTQETRAEECKRRGQEEEGVGELKVATSDPGRG